MVRAGFKPGVKYLHWEDKVLSVCSNHPPSWPLQWSDASSCFSSRSHKGMLSSLFPISASFQSGFISRALYPDFCEVHIPGMRHHLYITTHRMCFIGFLRHAGCWRTSDWNNTNCLFSLAAVTETSKMIWLVMFWKMKLKQFKKYITFLRFCFFLLKIIIIFYVHLCIKYEYLF